ncbi:MAG TPA: polysaccharide deacetylase family protein [Gemmatimonadaceae bacterium]|nr:polysaccharide deacetylase family protein [Gemmatimonadaceae bacterium]
MTMPEQTVRDATPASGTTAAPPEARRDEATPNGSRPTPPITVVMKRHVLGASSRLGLLKSLRDSGWRQRRLLILCYHSISIDDEHEWSGTYSMSPTLLEARLRMLRDGRYNVLPLDEAVRRLYDGTLPPRSVALTFDDGMYDFRARAWPLLQQFGFPATVYLTTYYSDYRKPIFGLFCSYVLWRARERALAPEVMALVDAPARWDLSDGAGRARAHRDILDYADREQLSLPERTALAGRLTDLLGDDYEAIRAKRILTVMTGDEATELARSGIDIELHTHRHRTPLDRALFLREITDNRERVDRIRAGTARHFCYPSGIYHSEFLPWLREAGVATATTCDPGLASSKSEPLLLPRLVDTSFLSPQDVEGWMTGISAFFMPRKARAHAGRTPVSADA